MWIKFKEVVENFTSDMDTKNEENTKCLFCDEVFSKS
jgi:hypothetical protein